MLKIKLIKTKCKYIYNIKKIDCKKKNSINSFKIGFLNKKNKTILIDFKKLVFFLKKGAKLSKGFIKIFKNIKKNDIQIL
ncbi:hypothetical protein [Candidatus Vidania fulgoroideorum]